MPELPEFGTVETSEIDTPVQAQPTTDLPEVKAELAAPRGAFGNMRARNRPRTMTADEVFLNQEIDALVEDYDVENKEDNSYATATHTTAGKVQMWKPSADGRTYTPRMVPAGNRAANLKNGWRPTCPDCNTNHEQSPYPAGDPNSCPGRDFIAVRLCPVCNKRITDNMAWVQNSAVDANGPDADHILRDDTLTSTPESRTRMQLNIHLWTFHASQARLMGIPPIPDAFTNPSLPPQQGTPVAAAVGM